MNKEELIIRNAKTEEFDRVGKLMINVYSTLEGFPKEKELPVFYDILANISEYVKHSGIELLVAVNSSGNILGAVVYIDDLTYYDPKNIKIGEENSSGFRFLVVNNSSRCLGIGRLLCEECINRSRIRNKTHVVIHSNPILMKVACKMYEKMGFQKAEDLNFFRNGNLVHGYRLKL